MRTLNVGLIGAGFMGKAHSLAYAALPMFFWPPPAVPVRKMVAELNAEAAAEAAARFGFETATADWRSLVESDATNLKVTFPLDLHLAEWILQHREA